MINAHVAKVWIENKVEERKLSLKGKNFTDTISIHERTEIARLLHLIVPRLHPSA